MIQWEDLTISAIYIQVSKNLKELNALFSYIFLKKSSTWLKQHSTKNKSPNPNKPNI